MLKRTEPGTAEMAQWVGVFTTKPDDLSSIPGTHTGAVACPGKGKAWLTMTSCLLTSTYMLE